MPNLRNQIGATVWVGLDSLLYDIKLSFANDDISTDSQVIGKYGDYKNVPLAEQRQAEYLEAKNFCDNGPEPGRNNCSSLSKAIEHAQECIDKYGAWDKRWLPGRHDTKIDTWKQRVKNLKEQHNEDCTD